MTLTNCQILDEANKNNGECCETETATETETETESATDKTQMDINFIDIMNKIQQEFCAVERKLCAVKQLRTMATVNTPKRQLQLTHVQDI